MQNSLLQRRIDAALGKIPCDLMIQNASVLNVFSGTWIQTDVGIQDGTIISLDRGLKAKRILDGKNRWVVPGFIDAHVHIESSLLLPSNFQKTVLPKGTTSAICDPHELANVEGVKGISFFLGATDYLNLDLYVMLSSCVPATQMETNGGGEIGVQDLIPLKNHPRALGLAEMMNVPGVLEKHSNAIDKIEAFQNFPMDGHCPLLTGRELSAYCSTGISSCHESSQLEEAREKLSKGLSIWIREGSVAKDLRQLIPLLDNQSFPFIGFCTDDRNPLDIFQEGHIDYLIKESIRMGIPPTLAYRSASWSVARHYGLDKGLNRKGAVAPGYQADLILLDDPYSCSISQVIKSGHSVNEIDFHKDSLNSFDNSIRASCPSIESLKAPTGNIHCIEVYPGKIITGRSVRSSTEPGVAKLTVLERYGHQSPPSNGYVYGFGESFRGAISSSVGHDSHNLCVVGSDDTDMYVALKVLIESGGGFAVVRDQKVLAHLPLPFGGLMTSEDAAQIKNKLLDLRAASRAIGCDLEEPFLQLAFLCLPVIPSLKLTDKGLVDVEKFQIIDVRA